MTTVVKATTKGQITLPAKWRRRFATDRFIVKEKQDTLEIIPLDLKKSEKENWITVFDAARHNDGKGIPSSKLRRILQELDDSE